MRRYKSMNSKEDLIKLLVEEYNEDMDELKSMDINELEERLAEFEDDSDLYPNGKDED